MAGWTTPISTSSTTGLPSRCLSRVKLSNNPSRALIPVTPVCSDRVSQPTIMEPQEDNRACPTPGFHLTTEWTLETRLTTNSSRNMEAWTECRGIGRHRRLQEWLTWDIHQHPMDIPLPQLFTRVANSKRLRSITRVVSSMVLIVRHSLNLKSIIKCTPNIRTCRPSRHNTNSLRNNILIWHNSSIWCTSNSNNRLRVKQQLLPCIHNSSHRHNIRELWPRLLGNNNKELLKGRLLPTSRVRCILGWGASLVSILLFRSSSSVYFYLAWYISCSRSTLGSYRNAHIGHFLWKKWRSYMFSKSESVKTHWFRVRNHCCECYKSST